MLKIARVCDKSRKEFNEGKGKLQVQGLNFLVDYDKEKAQNLVLNEEKIAKIYTLNESVVRVDIDDVTNVTKANRKALKDGSITSTNGKYNDFEVTIIYNKEEKEFYAILNLTLVLY